MTKWLRTVNLRHVGVSVQDHWRTVKVVIAHIRRLGWVVVGLGILSILLMVLGLWRDEGPLDMQPPLLSDMFGWLPWWIWLVLAFVLLVAVIIDATHQEIVARKEEINNVQIQLEGRIADLETQLRHELDEQLTTVLAYLKRGRALEDDIRRRQISSVQEMEALAESWANEVAAYLDEHLPEMTPRFWSDSKGREIWQPGAPHEVATIANFVERRREQLVDIEKDLTQRQAWYRAE